MDDEDVKKNLDQRSAFTCRHCPFHLEHGDLGAEDEFHTNHNAVGNGPCAKKI